MPFIEQRRRAIIEKEGLEGLAVFAKPGVAGMTGLQLGDLCYVAYKRLIDEWKKEPRWSTAHRLFKEELMARVETRDQTAARSLAWQVFFNLIVIPYELKKREENGDI